MPQTIDLNASATYFRKIRSGAATVAHVYAVERAEVGDTLRFIREDKPDRTLTARVLGVSKGTGSHDAVTFELDPASQRVVTGETPAERALLSRLGSALIHAAEALSENPHPFDAQAFRRILDAPEVRAWLDAMGPEVTQPRTPLDGPPAPEPPNVHAVIYADAEGGFRWRVVSRNGRTLADSAEGYGRRADALHGLALLVNGLPFGRLVDEDGETITELRALPVDR